MSARSNITCALLLPNISESLNAHGLTKSGLMLRSKNKGHVRCMYGVQHAVLEELGEAPLRLRAFQLFQQLDRLSDVLLWLELVVEDKLRTTQQENTSKPVASGLFPFRTPRELGTSED